MAVVNPEHDAVNADSVEAMRMLLHRNILTPDEYLQIERDAWDALERVVPGARNNPKTWDGFKMAVTSAVEDRVRAATLAANMERFLNAPWPAIGPTSDGGPAQEARE